MRLALFALGCTALVAVTDHFTRERIAGQSQKQLQQTLGELLPAQLYDNDLSASCVQRRTQIAG